MHIDMDAFYASIEQLDNPELRGKALIVGGRKRGVVSTASYEARKFGVHSAMPIGEARRLCPHAVFLVPRMRRYVEMAHVVRGVLHEFSPLVEAASIDEAYLDATGLERLFGPIENMGMRLKEAVREATGGLTCSVGVAPVKFLAKISSEMRKPDGLFMLRPEEVPGFMAGLDVGRIPGVGKKFAAALASVGVRKAGDALRYPRDFWERRYGKVGLALYERAQGRDSRPVVPFTPPKSESAETTFEVDTRDRDFLKAWLLRHAERVGRSLRKQGLAGRTVTLKIKYADFKQNHPAGHVARPHQQHRHHLRSGLPTVGRVVSGGKGAARRSGGVRLRRRASPSVVVAGRGRRTGPGRGGGTTGQAGRSPGCSARALRNGSRRSGSPVSHGWGRRPSAPSGRVNLARKGLSAPTDGVESVAIRSVAPSPRRRPPAGGRFPPGRRSASRSSRNKPDRG